MRILVQSALAALALAASSNATAYTAYLMPQNFTPPDDVSIQAVYATQFFNPALALGAADFHVITPENSRASFSSMRVEQNATTYDLNLVTSGTYLATTGEILGPVTNMVGIDGGWRALQAGELAPEGAPTTTLQTVTLADTYFSKGRPNEDALDDLPGSLVILPVTHPNRIAQAEGFTVQLMLNGAPFPNMPLVLYAEGDPEAMLDRAFVTGADGRATLTFDHPGNYVVAIRHRGPGPAGSQAQILSYTSSLTFQVYDVLPELPPEEAQPQRRRDRRSRY